MGWKSWAARIGGYAAAPWTGGASIPVGEAIAQGIESHGAVNTANQQQQAGTREAGERLGAAQTANAELYNQQRQDYQNLANAPFQTLGGLMGMAIPNIEPVNTSTGMIATHPMPMGRLRIPEGAAPGSMLGAPGTPITPPGTSVPRSMPAPEYRANLQTLSSYARPRAKKAQA